MTFNAMRVRAKGTPKIDIKRIRATRGNKTRMSRCGMIRNVLIKIPIPMENPTKPFRYSFFSGLKKVLMKVGSEKRTKKASLRERKNLRIPTGASRYQNFKKRNGRTAKLGFMTNF